MADRTERHKVSELLSLLLINKDFTPSDKTSKAKFEYLENSIPVVTSRHSKQSQHREAKILEMRMIVQSFAGYLVGAVLGTRVIQNH